MPTTSEPNNAVSIKLRIRILLSQDIHCPGLPWGLR